jgi:hypothetical protein
MPKDDICRENNRHTSVRLSEVILFELILIYGSEALLLWLQQEII